MITTTPTIRRAERADFPTITSLAHAIWRPTYSPILSVEQIDFMLEKLYASQGLDEAVRQGRVFYLLEEAEKPIGFMAVRELPETRILRIESLYLLPLTQGKGYGSMLIDFAAELAISSSQRILELNVNRQNKAQHFYRKQGFEVIREVDIPYHDYVLDDYVMQKRLQD